jgi:hypothetical protein
LNAFGVVEDAFQTRFNSFTAFIEHLLVTDEALAFAEKFILDLNDKFLFVGRKGGRRIYHLKEISVDSKLKAHFSHLRL